MCDEIFELIKTRRSIRSYLPEPVSRETIKKLLEAAAWAPTGGNVQPWCFGIVDEPKMIQDISSFSPGLFGNPPVLFVMCIDTDLARKKGGDTSPEILARMDVALASENLMLAAHALGLGTCMIRSFNITAVSALLGLPEHIQIETLISLGKPNKVPLGKRRPMKEVTFCNTWGGKV